MFKRTCTDLTKIPKEKVRQWLTTIESVIFDADGVLWHLNRPINGAVETFNMIKSSGRQVLVATNHSGLLTKDLAAKAHQFGYEIQEEQILSSALSVARFLSAKGFKKKAYIVGESAIVDELAKENICSFSVGKEKLLKPMEQFAKDMYLDHEVGAVIIGKDESFNVPKIIRASSYLQEPKVLFLGTCLDTAYPVGKNRMIVGAGAMVAAVKAITGRMPLILGKPNPLMVEQLLQCGVLKRESTLMVGDTLYTDILFASNCGFQSLFVGTGVSILKEVRQICNDEGHSKVDMIPDTYLPSLGHLREFLC
ncbi:GL13742 [Drosophila persimilis]|uniref:GL13742 n=2 Tax=Drosophila persimilis TaxID=7234 RepID=B4GNR3_DROPE|nr:glycerol-3-phosphate phosphatase [Drosophila persimilis]XP_002028847.2 glycerol-3-phosphate phosphatase [Drosophila persimilis]EDW38796.1 GL13742 [Drosophila persimilis]